MSRSSFPIAFFSLFLATLGPAVAPRSAVAQSSEFGPPVAYPAGTGPFSVGVADFNHDGALDLAVLDLTTQGVSILLGNGDGTFQAPQATILGTTVNCLVVGDFNGDGNPDVVVSQGGFDTVAVLLGNGDGTFQPPAAYTVGGTSTGMAVGDLNGDGNLDLVVANVSGGTNNFGNVSVLLGNGDGTFQPAVNFVAANGPLAVALGDFNHDGALDMAVVDTRANSLSILLGNGHGNFQAPTNYSAGLTPNAIAFADFNGDGNPDLAVLAPGGKLGLFLGNGDGTFTSKGLVPLAGFGLSVTAADVNEDGAQDLIVSNYTAGTVGVLLGRGDGTFETAAYAASSGPFPVYNAVPADLNGDGRLDLAVADEFQCEINVLLNLGATPTAVLSPPSLSFPTQVVGATSAVQHATLTNNGSAALILSSTTASASFLQSNDCGSNLAIGASCNLSVQFRPSARGTATGSITLTDNAPGSPQALTLTGTGTVVSLSPSSVAFGNVAVGQSASATVTVTNLARNASLQISKVTVGSTPPFSGTSTCGTSLGPGARCTVTVTFAPAATGTFGGSVTVTDNGGGTIQTALLSGTGATK